jgi:hypothetical protein
VSVTEQAPAKQPVNPELFARTAPQWNCVDFPGDGMHYWSAGPVPPRGDCVWCGMTAAEIQAEYAARAALTAGA